MKTTKLYRVEGIHYTDGIRLQMMDYAVTKETPKGFWIALWPKRWVSKTSRKRFAHPTRDEAIVAFRFRKKRQLEILTERLNSAKRALALLDSAQPFDEVSSDNLLL